MAYKTELDYINSNADIIVRAIDVGPGDCLLIQTGSQNVLVDTGNPSRKHLLPVALKKYGATTLHKIIITHPHVDHQGNLIMLLEDPNFTVNEVYTNGVNTGEGSTQEKYKNMLGNKYKILRQGDILNLGNDTVWTTLWPTNEFMTEIQRRVNNELIAKGKLKESASDENSGSTGTKEGLESNKNTYSMNNSSIVGRLVKGNFTMLFTGDAGGYVFDTLVDVVSKLYPITCKIFKAAHHSQNMANPTSVVLGNLHTETIIITAGDHQNPYPRTSGSKGWNGVSPFVHTINKLVKGYTHNGVWKHIDANRIYATRFNGDITIGVFDSEYIVYPAVQDYLWQQRWRELCNRYILQENPSHSLYNYRTNFFDDPSLLTMTMINVGVGDAILFRKDDKTVLFDCGNWSNAYDNKGKLFEEAMKRYNVGHIDTIIITHPHGDHNGNLEPMINNRKRFPYVAIDENTTMYHCGNLNGSREINHKFYASETYRGTKTVTEEIDGKKITKTVTLSHPYLPLYRNDNDVSSNENPRTVELFDDVKFYVYNPSQEFMDNAVTYFLWSAAKNVADNSNEGENGDQNEEATENITQWLREKRLLLAKTALDTNGVSVTTFFDTACDKVIENYNKSVAEKCFLLQLLTDAHTLKTTTGLAAGDTPESKAATEACERLTEFLNVIELPVNSIKNKTSEIAEAGTSYTSYVASGFTDAVTTLSSENGITVTGTLSTESETKIAKGVTAALAISDFNSAGKNTLAKVMSREFIKAAAIAVAGTKTTVTAAEIDNKINSFTLEQVINMSHAFVTAISYLRSSPKSGTTTETEKREIAEIMAKVLLSLDTTTNAVRTVAYFRGKRFDAGISEVDLTVNPTKTQKTYTVNDCSITGKIVYKNISIMMTGDCDQTNWADIHAHYGTSDTDPKSPKSLRCTILKSPHHSSQHNNTTILLDDTRPETCLMTCGGYFDKYPTKIYTSNAPDGSFGTLISLTPRQLTLNRLIHRETLMLKKHNIFSTRLNHDVTVKINGDTYWVFPDLDDRTLPKEERFLRKYRNAFKNANVLSNDFWPDDEDIDLI